MFSIICIGVLMYIIGYIICYNVCYFLLKFDKFDASGYATIWPFTLVFWAIVFPFWGANKLCEYIVSKSEQEQKRRAQEQINNRIKSLQEQIKSNNYE